MGSVFEAQGLSCSIACEIFPDWGSNPCPWHWQADSYPLYHQGSLVATFWDSLELYLMLTPIASYPVPSTLFYFIHGPSHYLKLSSFASFWVACHPHWAIWPKRGEALSLLHPQCWASQRYTVGIQVIPVERQTRPERLFREAGPAPGETFSLKGSPCVPASLLNEVDVAQSHRKCANRPAGGTEEACMCPMEPVASRVSNLSTK